MNDVLNTTNKHICEYIIVKQHKINMLKIFNIIFNKTLDLSAENNEKLLILCDLINENKILYENLYLKSNIFIVGLHYSKTINNNREFDFLPRLSNNTNNWEGELEQISSKIKNHDRYSGNYYFQDLYRLLDLGLDFYTLQYFIIKEYLEQYIPFIMENI